MLVDKCERHINRAYAAAENNRWENFWRALQEAYRTFDDLPWSEIVGLQFRDAPPFNRWLYYFSVAARLEKEGSNTDAILCCYYIAIKAAEELAGDSKRSQSKKLGEISRRIRMLVQAQVGRIFIFSGDYKKGLDSPEALFEDDFDWSNFSFSELPMLYAQMGVLYSDLIEDYEQALKYSEEALQIAEELNSLFTNKFIIKIFTNMAELYTLSGKLEKSLNVFNQFLENPKYFYELSLDDKIWLFDTSKEHFTTLEKFEQAYEFNNKLYQLLDKEITEISRLASTEYEKLLLRDFVELRGKVSDNRLKLWEKLPKDIQEKYGKVAKKPQKQSGRAQKRKLTTNPNTAKRRKKNIKYNNRMFKQYEQQNNQENKGNDNTRGYNKENQPPTPY